MWLALVLAASLAAGVAGFQDASDERVVRLRFPDRVDLTALWLRYFLRGPFGMSGSVARLDPGRREYVIDSSRDGQPATTFEAIVYVPGHRFVVLNRLPLDSRGGLTRSIELQPLGSVRLSGEIILARPVKGLSLEAGYMPTWECDVFQLIDCLQTWIPVARTVVTEDGRFALDVPDFARDPTVVSYTGRQRGHLRLFLLETSTGNIPYDVEDVRARDRAAELPVASEYPQDLQLVVVPRR